MRNHLTLAFLLVLETLFLIPAADAAIYRYIDKNNLPCFTDDLQSIPENYRATAVVVDDGSSDEPNAQTKAELPDSSTAGGPLEIKKVENHPLPLLIRLVISAGVGILALLILALVKRMPELKEREKTVSIIQRILIGIVSIYIVAAHAGDFVNAVGAVRGAIGDAESRSAEKGRKAAKAIKTLNTMLEEAQKNQADEDPQQ